MPGLAVVAWGLAGWLAGAPRVWADAPLSVDGSALAEAVAVDLTVAPLEGWRRSQWFDETGLPWVDPSPNIPIGWRGTPLRRDRAARGDERVGRSRNRHPVRAGRSDLDHRSLGAG